MYGFWCVRLSNDKNDSDKKLVETQTHIVVLDVNLDLVFQLL
jgi:hypothetical protein